MSSVLGCDLLLLHVQRHVHEVPSGFRYGDFTALGAFRMFVHDPPHVPPVKTQAATAGKGARIHVPPLSRLLAEVLRGDCQGSRGGGLDGGVLDVVEGVTFPEPSEGGGVGHRKLLGGLFAYRIGYGLQPPQSSRHAADVAGDELGLQRHPIAGRYQAESSGVVCLEPSEGPVVRVSDRREPRLQDSSLFSSWIESHRVRAQDVARGTSFEDLNITPLAFFLAGCPSLSVSTLSFSFVSLLLFLVPLFFMLLGAEQSSPSLAVAVSGSLLSTRSRLPAAYP